MSKRLGKGLKPESWWDSLHLATGPGDLGVILGSAASVDSGPRSSSPGLGACSLVLFLRDVRFHQAAEAILGQIRGSCAES